MKPVRNTRPLVKTLLELNKGDELFLKDVIKGLSCNPKQLPCKYFYDEAGSKLFDQICELDEYYPTRTELEIMKSNIDDISGKIGSDCALIEFGSGSSMKTRLLLSNMTRISSYIPIDISEQHLFKTAESLSHDFPEVPVIPVFGDFTSKVILPKNLNEHTKRVVYFPGSTIGNFTAVEASSLLSEIASLVGKGGGLLIGVDLVKSQKVLEAAYNDSSGITAQFNLNILKRMKRELNVEIRLDKFMHKATYNTAEERVEMHLESLADQYIKIIGHEFELKAGETIHTENSHKYRLDKFEGMANSSGLSKIKIWTDKDNLFSVQYFELP